MGFDENEISEKSNGGTEITKRSIASKIPKEIADQFQIIPSRVRNIEEDKIRIYWLHDLPEDPEINHLKDYSSQNKFHKFVFSSNWQCHDFFNKIKMSQDEKVQVIETAVDPIIVEPKSTDRINLIYFSTPQRGLELLVPVFEELSKKHDNVHLDVFSSFKIYGWDSMDQQYESVYERIRQHPRMTYHGFVEQDVIRDHLKKAHILAYPSVWKETSCRVLIESMSAGLMCVHSNLAALADTAGGLTTMYQFQDNVNHHSNMFYQYLEHAVRVVNTENIQNYLKFVKVYADSRFNLNKVSSQWETLMRDLLEKYPTVESRSIPQKMFTYSS